MQRNRSMERRAEEGERVFMTHIRCTIADRVEDT
jgi:hypothetical protein